MPTYISRWKSNSKAYTVDKITDKLRKKSQMIKRTVLLIESYIFISYKKSMSQRILPEIEFRYQLYEKRRATITTANSKTFLCFKDC